MNSVQHRRGPIVKVILLHSRSGIGLERSRRELCHIRAQGLEIFRLVHAPDRREKMAASGISAPGQQSMDAPRSEGTQLK